MTTLDPTRALATVVLERVPAVLIGAEGQALRPMSRVLDLACVALAAEQAGGARRCLEMSAGYARTRFQFGRPIGSFQAVKHKCADMLVRVELAGASAREAARLADEGAPEFPVAAATAHICCSQAYLFAATENIQVHGGIGFTWEHPAHLYFRRAKSSELLFGGPGRVPRTPARPAGHLNVPPAGLAGLAWLGWLDWPGWTGPAGLGREDTPRMYCAAGLSRASVPGRT